MIGYIIHEYQTKVLDKINSATALVFMIIGGVLSVCEWLLVGGRQQMYLGSILVAANMIIFSQMNAQRFVLKPIAIIGQKYSMLIYILHYSIGIALDTLTPKIGISENFIFLCFRPTIVILLSVFSSIIITFIWSKWISFLKNRKEEKQKNEDMGD